MNAARSGAQALEHYWMPFTDNRRFKQAPKMIASAKDMYYVTEDGKQVLDGLATLWCVNAGHCRPKIVEAIRKQAGTLDYASSFSLGHRLPFEVAARIAELAPGSLNHVFFTNSGSEAADTALKIALAYHRLKGEPSRTRFIGREKGYHGVNLAGISVGGVSLNRKAYAGALLGGVDHLRHTQDLNTRAFVRGCAETGAELADELEERIIPLHGAENIAAVIVEPVSGAGGVPVPLGGVIASDAVYETFMASRNAGVEFFHGYTYSGHPLACAAAMGTLDTYAEEGLLKRATGALAKAFEDAIHSFKGAPHVVDCRSLGLIGAIELAPRAGAPGARGFEVFEKCWEKGVYVRPIGDNVGFCPPLIVEQKHFDQMFGAVAEVLNTVS